MRKIFSKIIYGTLAVSMLLSTQGCKDYFDVGNNPNLITEPSINSLLSTATHKTGINARSFSGISSYYTQYIASPSLASPTDIFEVTDLSDRWNLAYYAMADIQDLISRSEAIGAHHHVGVGKLLMAYNLSLVADTWDMAPYTEAFMKVNTVTPSYQTGEELYEIIGKLIEEGISSLGNSAVTVSLDKNLDLIHAGSTSAWLKTGYALKARHLNKVSKKSSYSGTQVLSAIDNSYSSATDEMKMGVYVGNNPWAAIAISNAGSLLGGWLSSNLMEAMDGTKYGLFDPRLENLTDKTIHNDYTGTRNGAGNKGPAGNTVKDETYISINSPVTSTTAPIFIINYEEIKFIEAEAALRSNQRERAYDAYLAGIKASMKTFNVSDSKRDLYINDPSISVGKENLTLDHIFKEKYVALYLNFETWNDARRFNYAYKDFKMPANAVLGSFIRRVAYPVTEITRNPDHVPADSPLDTPLWWDKP